MQLDQIDYAKLINCSNYILSGNMLAYLKYISHNKKFLFHYILAVY